MLYKLYGDTQTMRDHCDAMKTYMDFVARRKAGTGADAYIVTALLADWVSNEQTSQQMFGTWGYYLRRQVHVRDGGADRPHRGRRDLRRRSPQNIKTAYNNRFFNTTLHRYTAAGNGGTTGATQAAQAIALDAGPRARGRAGERPAGAGGQHLRLPPRSAAARTSAPATSGSARSCAR